MKQLMLMCMVLAVAGCTTTQKATTTGALGGAALGGIIGHQSGHGVEGAAIGGVAGALTGYIIGENMDE